MEVGQCYISIIVSPFSPYNSFLVSSLTQSHFISCPVISPGKVSSNIWFSMRHLYSNALWTKTISTRSWSKARAYPARRLEEPDKIAPVVRTCESARSLQGTVDHRKEYSGRCGITTGCLKKIKWTSGWNYVATYIKVKAEPTWSVGRQWLASARHHHGRILKSNILSEDSKEP